jgi:hypothetical protein
MMRENSFAESIYRLPRGRFAGLPVVALVPVFQSAQLTEGKRLLQLAHSTAKRMALEYAARDRVDLAV